MLHLDSPGAFALRDRGSHAVCLHRFPRRPSERAERVAPEELMAAARIVLRAADFMPEDELAVEIREVLGLRRTQQGTVSLQQAIQTLLQQGDAIHSVAGIRLRPAVSQA